MAVYHQSWFLDVNQKKKKRNTAQLKTKQLKLFPSSPPVSSSGHRATFQFQRPSLSDLHTSAQLFSEITQLLYYLGWKDIQYMLVFSREMLAVTIYKI